jgi:hypothetical protein
VVITDRYIDSSVAYQGAGRGLGAEGVLSLNEWATEGLHPDLTVLLDVDPSDGRQRRTAGDAAEDRLESEPDDFHSAIRHAFLDLAAAAPSSYLVLPANADIDSLAAQILERVESAPAHMTAFRASVRECLGRPPGAGTRRCATEAGGAGRNGLTHAWLFTGPPGSGRSNAAKAFAAALNCEQDDVNLRGCGTVRGMPHDPR